MFRTFARTSLGNGIRWLPYVKNDQLSIFGMFFIFTQPRSLLHIPKPYKFVGQNAKETCLDSGRAQKGFAIWTHVCFRRLSRNFMFMNEDSKHGASAIMLRNGSSTFPGRKCTPLYAHHDRLFRGSTMQMLDYCKHAEGAPGGRKCISLPTPSL